MGRITDAFAETWMVRQLPSFIAADATAMIAELVAAADKLMDSHLTDIAERDQLPHFPAGFVYDAPADVAIGIERYLSAVTTRVLVENQAVVAAMGIFTEWETALPDVPMARPRVYTPTRLRQLANRGAMIALIRRSGALAGAQRMMGLRTIAPHEALTLRDAYNAMFAPVIADASDANDGSARALHNVLVAVVALLTERIGPINTLAYFSTQATLPLHVVAHMIYQDARESPRLFAANPVPHPTFMPTDLQAPAIT